MRWKVRKKKGSVFTVTLPLNWRRMTRRWSARERSGSCFQGLAVLVVDDDPLVGSQATSII